MEALSSSSLPSSIADFPASPGLILDAANSSENDGGDCDSPIRHATTSELLDPHDLPSQSFDYGGPKTAGPNMPESPLDYISEDLELDVMKPTCCDVASCDHQQDSCSDDMFASHLDELLQADMPQEFLDETNLMRVDDLFPTLQGMGQDFLIQDSIYACSAESLRGLEAVQFPEDKVLQAETVSCSGEDESASQMFARWLHSNAHWISLSDLRKIKLKTSTIENATRRLGGGKKGLMLFLKFVLMWVQDSRLKPPTQLEEAMMHASDMHLGTSLATGCLGPSTRNDAPRRPFEGHTYNLASPFSPHLATSQSCLDWMPRARWEQPSLVSHNGVPPITSSHTFAKSGGSPLPSTDFCRSTSTWLNQSHMQRAGVSPCLSASGNGSNIGGAGLRKDATSIMMLMQQQHCSATPAATTRAARKSRMERQRWSVRHNRRWSASVQHRLPTTASVRANSSSWSQALANGSQSFPHANARNGQQQRIGGRSSIEFQQTYKRPEKNLRLLFQKELKQSDVGNIGRIVLPKAAETCLPPLEMRDGLNLLVDDMNSSKVWNMRYRFWPNNKSRMYVLENTSDFVKTYNLKEGDYMMLFCDTVSGKYVIRGAKGPVQAAGLSGKEGMECMNDVSILCNEVNKRRLLPQEGSDCVAMSTPNSEESCDDSLFAELIEQSLEDMKEF